MDRSLKKALQDLRSFCLRRSDLTAAGVDGLAMLARALDGLQPGPGDGDTALSLEEALAALEAIPELRAMYLSPDLRIRWCSPALESIARIQGKSLSGRRCYRAVHGRTAVCAGCPVLVALERGRPYEAPMTWNEFAPQLLYAGPVLGTGGAVDGVLVVAAAPETDPLVGPQRAAAPAAPAPPSGEAAPRRAAGQGVNVVSAGLNLMAVAPENAGYMGRTAAELLGKKCHREIAGRDDVCPGCPGVRTLATGLPAQSETEGRRPDGSRFFALIQTEPVFDPDEKVIAFTEVVSDITDAVFLRQIGRFGEGVSAALEAAPLSAVLEGMLDAALELDGFTGGVAYLASRESGEMRTVAQRNVPVGLLPGIRHAPRPSDGRAGFAGVRGEASIFILPFRLGGRLVAELRLTPSMPGTAAPVIVQTLECCRSQVAARFAQETAECERAAAAGFAEALLACSPTPVWCVDENNRVIRWNPAAARVFGWTEVEVLHDRPPMAVAGAPEWAGIFEIRAGLRTVHGYELPCACKDGSILRMTVTIVPAHVLRPADIAGMFIIEPLRS